MSSYVVATIKTWNIKNFESYTNDLPGSWHLITEENELNESFLEKIDPEYIFFPHWSWIVPEKIIQQYKCICFHMTDVPFGRGGSPLQNLIARGHKTTKLTALKMTKSLDAGPIYLKYPMTLDGSAEDILKRASLLSYMAIAEIIENKVEPIEQEGEVTVFKRRTPEQSEINEFNSLEALYNHIRMLDAEGYPRAFIDIFKFRIELYDAKLSNESLNAKINIRKRADHE